MTFICTNVENCINVYTPTLTADNALKVAVSEVLGVENVTTFRRRRRVLLDEEDGKLSGSVGRDSSGRVGSHLHDLEARAVRRGGE